MDINISIESLKYIHCSNGRCEAKTHSACLEKQEKKECDFNQYPEP